MRTLLFLLIIFASSNLFGQTQNKYKDIDFRAPLNIPLVLAGNFAELRTNHFHSGIDIKTNHKQGYRVYAVDSGYVSRINISHWGYGKAIYITHPNGFTTVYAHLRNFPKKIEKVIRAKQFELEQETVDFNLSPNQLKVDRGEVVAFSGNTGGSTAPHLHFEIRETESEFPLNPLLFKFDIKDNIPPSIFNLKIYPISGTVNNTAKESVYPVIKNATTGVYSLKNNPTIELSGKIGFGIHTIDRLNAANNKCGIYSIELLMNGKSICKQELEKLDFSTSRYINIYKDYDEYHQKRRSIHKSFKLYNNDLDVYTKLTNQGIVNFTKDTVVEMLYIIKDTYGNTSKLKFKVKSVNAPSAPAQSKSLVNPLAPFVLNNEDVEITIPPKSIYTPVELKYKKEKTLHSKAALHTIGNSKIPLQKQFVLRIKSTKIKPSHENKAVIVHISDDKKKAFAKGGKYKNGWVESKVKKMGSYTIQIDSVAPKVVPIKFVDGQKFTPSSTMQFKVSDNLSGIKSYKVYIDNVFKISNYFPRKNILKLSFNEYNAISKGKHTLKLVVKDERENETVSTYTFTLL